MNSPHPRVPTIDVLGTSIHAINLHSACDLVSEAVRAKRKGYVCVVGVHGVTEAFDHADFHEILEGAFLATPDGMPMTWLGRWQGASDMARVYGPDFMLEVCRQSIPLGFTHYFYGGAPGVADLLKEKLTQRYPGLQVVGTFCPPYRPLNEGEESALIHEVSQLKPDMIWVGLGTPKQERFMAEYLPKLETTLMFGVGAAFDFHTQRVKQAPSWMQRSGLEWFYRLTQEPRRLFSRYFRNNTLFLWRLFTGRKPVHLYHRLPQTVPSKNSTIHPPS